LKTASMMMVPDSAYGMLAPSKVTTGTMLLRRTWRPMSRRSDIPRLRSSSWVSSPVTPTESVRNEVRAMLGEVHDPTAHAQNASPPFTPRAKKVLELSLREALKLGHSYIGTEHILLGIIREGESVATQVLTQLGVSLAAARQRVIALISGQEHEGQTGNPAGVPVRSPFVRVGPASAEPRCPQCRADVSEGARYRTISVQPDASSDDENPLRTYVVYCGECGVSLHMFTPDHPS
jgi:hypothetical protein